MRMLDLCCGAGGAAVGYNRAGFSEIVGVDIDAQPRYPFEFWQRDAMTMTYEEILSFDFIHASPPCQQYSRGSVLARKQGKVYPDLIDPVRRMLVASGKPYVIENVVGAPVRPDICLCGTMFGLGVLRHRYFETNLPIKQTLTCQHDGTVIDGDYVTVAGNGGHGGKKFADWKRAMQIDWMTKVELKESIPPAFTEWIGREALLILECGEMSIDTQIPAKNRRAVEVDTWTYPQQLALFG